MIEDYKPLDVECAAVALALCAASARAIPEWRLLVDGDGGDENLKDYPIEENTELTIRSVVDNRMLYQEGWGVDSIKHSLTYSGGYSRGLRAQLRRLRRHGFVGFSPFTRPAVIAVAEAIPFAELTRARRSACTPSRARSWRAACAPCWASRCRSSRSAASSTARCLPAARRALFAAGEARLPAAFSRAVPGVVALGHRRRRPGSARCGRPRSRRSWRPAGRSVEAERGPGARWSRVLTVFLAGSECPFTCSSATCGATRSTCRRPPGALPPQIRLALAAAVRRRDPRSSSTTRAILRSPRGASRGRAGRSLLCCGRSAA